VAGARCTQLPLLQFNPRHATSTSPTPRSSPDQGPINKIHDVCAYAKASSSAAAAVTAAAARRRTMSREILAVDDVFYDDGTPSSPSSEKDHEKDAPPSGRIGDQIPHALLEELAPNGEGEYILDKVNAMSEAEALEIVRESLAFHDDDWNFPSDMRARMQRLVAEGRKGYGDDYDRDLRIDAVMMRYSSPYPGVRAVAEPVDDDTVPIETPRAYFLGIVWAVIGTFVSTFFNSRFPSVGPSLYPTRAGRY
jgi:hypothetical protein